MKPSSLNRSSLYVVSSSPEPQSYGLTRRPRKNSNHANCNICGRLYRAATSYHRFCRFCRKEDELFKFAEWLSQS